MIFSVFKKIGFLGILGPPYCGIGNTIRIGREMLCLPYAGFFTVNFVRAATDVLKRKRKKLKALNKSAGIERGVSLSD